MKRFTWLSILMVFSLVIVACGASEEPAPAAESVAVPTEAPVEQAEEDMATVESIVEIAVADGRFTTLVAAVQAAGLADTLSGEGDFTVFAPTDDAFAALPEGTVESLLEDPEGALKDILLYHVAEGAIPAETVVTLDSATTIQGESVSVMVADGNVFLNEGSQVIITDIEASNGIIHVIDTVLMPPSMVEAAMPLSIAQIAAADGQFSTLLAALEAAGLDETLAGEGAFTVLAPTDSAFAMLPEGTIESLLEQPEGALTDVLLYHVFDGLFPSETVAGWDSAKSLLGEDMSFMVVEGEVTINDIYKVITADIEASNGLIHVIDGVLLPPSMMATETQSSITEIAVADGRFTTLVTALEAAGLAETLAGDGEFTVFAPTDDAFAALPEDTVESLLQDPMGALKDILLYHVTIGGFPAESVVMLDPAPMLQGQTVSIRLVDGEVYLNDSVKVIITDIEASNGIIHVIDGVLLPPTEVEMQPTIAEIAVEDGRFTTLVAALDAAGLVDTFSNAGAFTVFAPTDDAFAALPEGTVASLLEDPLGALTDILLYHVVDGVVMAEAVVALESATSMLGQDVSITIDNGNVFLNGNVQVIITDIEASNGVIHVIDTVLIPAG
jgi:uncharacterized surface protein with fasciclin (FAS1) repeats